MNSCSLPLTKSAAILMAVIAISSGATPKASAQSPMSALSRASSFASMPEMLNYDGRYASAPSDLPEAVQRIVDAANSLQGKPYVWGGGHKYLYDHGYDCSGSVSYVLYKAGLVRGPMMAREFHSYGAPGPGRFITLFVSNSHVFISVCGLRFDTSDHGSNRGQGPKWRPTARSFAGFEVRHIPGL
jgi:hypothetical protein